MRENILHLLRELLWLGLTAMVVYAALYPITTQIYYRYELVNAAFIFVAITYFRWSVTFRSLPFLRPAVLRFLLFTANFVLFIYLLHNLQTLIGKLDEFYMEDFGFPKLIMYEDVKQQLFHYLSIEIVLSGTASLITIVAFQLRLIISYWQYYKHQASRMLED